MMADIIGALKRGSGNLAKWYYDYDRRAADATALTDGFGPANSNALAHAYLSAWITIGHGSFQARMLGDGRERWEPGPTWDTFKDLWNNEVGRRIGEYVKYNNLPPEVVPALVSDALARGNLIVTRTDRRIPADWNNTNVGVKAPSDFNADPGWAQPSGSWAPPPGFKPVPVLPPPPWSDPINGLIYPDARRTSSTTENGVHGNVVFGGNNQEDFKVKGAATVGQAPAAARARARAGGRSGIGYPGDNATTATGPAIDSAASRQAEFYRDPLADERASSADPMREADTVREDAESSRQDEATDRAAAYRQHAAAAHLARVAEAKRRIPDFDQVIRSGGQVPIAPGVADEILNSEKSALLQYHLAGNPDKLAELNGLTELNLAREIGRLEGRLHLPTARTVTEASPPLSDVRGSAAPMFDLHKTDDMDAFADWLREDQARRRRA